MDITRLDLNLLTTLDVLLAERNVTRAAARLHLSQPAVSAQLARLRDIFDDPLLIPAHRGMTATAKATELREPLRLALDHLRNALEATSGFDPAAADMVFTIACSDYVEVALIVPMVGLLRRAAPGVRLAIRRLSPALVDRQLAIGDADLVIAQPTPDLAHLRTRILFRETYVLIGRHGHPGLRHEMTIDDYVRLDHVILSRDGGTFDSPVDEALGALGYRRNVVLSAASFLFLPEIVAASDLVALLPRRLFAARADRLTGVELPWLEQSFDIGLIWGDRCDRHPGHGWLREQIAHLAGQASTDKEAAMQRLPSQCSP